MRIDIITLFVDMFDSFRHSIIARARKKGLIEINLVDIRAFSKDKHKKCDDYPFGGGRGMVMTPQPLYDAIKSVKRRNSRVIYMSPKGSVLNQQKVEELSRFKHLVLVCGHYEGIDQRVIDLLVDEEISVGDYVLTGGELAAEVLTDAVSRYVDGVIEKGSVAEESFADGFLEYPHYTRPAEFKKLKVPEVLLGGNHAEIAKWRQEQSRQITKERRPDLLKN